MATALDAEAWKSLDTLIRKALKERETYRTGTQNGRTRTAAWKPIAQLLAKFPEGPFTKNDHRDIINIDPYGKEVLTALTEGIWAFSLGPVLDDLDCPQTATDLYSYFGQDLYQVWYHSEPRDKNIWAALFREVTNDTADDNLITKDTAVRHGLVNSPRAAMGAHAWVITNSMTGNDEHEKRIVNSARQFWEKRCGPFVVSQN
jgi:hypothetical protein